MYRRRRSSRMRPRRVARRRFTGRRRGSLNQRVGFRM